MSSRAEPIWPPMRRYNLLLEAKRCFATRPYKNLLGAEGMSFHCPNEIAVILNQLTRSRVLQSRAVIIGDKTVENRRQDISCVVRRKLPSLIFTDFSAPAARTLWRMWSGRILYSTCAFICQESIWVKNLCLTEPAIHHPCVVLVPDHCRQSFV